MKKKDSIYRCLILVSSLFLMISCGGDSFSSSLNSSVTTSEETTSNTTSQNEGNKEVGVLKNYLKNLNLKGYVGNNLKNNVKYWQTSAYKDNPNIITQIDEASHFDGDITLNRLLGTDYFNVDQSFDINIYEKENIKYLGWKMKSLPSSFGDRDIRYGSDPNAITNWKGAKELWIYVDSSEINSSTSLRIAFEDDSIGIESYSLIEGSKIKSYSGTETKDISVSSGGFLPLEEGFKGYIALPLDSSHFSRYYNNGGNNIIDFANIPQFQIAVKSDANMVGKTFYMKDFAIVGDVSGDALPVEIDSSDTYKVIWNIDNVKSKTENSYSSSLPWYGEFVGKLLTGIAFSYKAYPDEELAKAANEIVDALYLAQGEDGYLGVFTGGSRYSIKTSNWDLWNQYHCIVGLLEWSKISGNTRAFEISKKCIDKIYDVFHDRSYIVSGGFETNRAIAHGYALMYQATKDDKYLNEAERIIMTDCQDYNGWYKSALKGKFFYTTSSARWEVLHMIMTLGILYEETENSEYYDVMSAIWDDLSINEIHNSGGFTTNECATGDPYKEGVIETCCTIAWMAFSNEYYKYSLDVNVVDELEKSYFNALLGALEDDDKYCTYNTPVNGIQGVNSNGYDGRRVRSQQDISFQYNQGSPDMNCCQANIARGIGQLSEWAILTDGPALYLNYYGTSSAKTIVNGKDITITQTTNYPLDGKINLIIDDLSSPLDFKLKLRIPSWCKSANVSYDGKSIEANIGEYFEINKTWKNGDEVNIDLGLQFTAWKGKKSQSAYTSVYYGPILLALDQYALSMSESTLDFNRSIEISNLDFKNATISKGASYGAWIYVDVPVNDSFVRLVDFASAGKYNGKSTPSSYYSWLNVSGTPVSTSNGLERWKTPLY